MNYILYDGDRRTDLLPFTYTRPMAEIRIGILTIREKWEHYLEQSISYLTEDYLQEKFPAKLEDDNTYILGGLLPNADLVTAIRELSPDSALVLNSRVLAYRAGKDVTSPDAASLTLVEFQGQAMEVANTWDIFARNGEAIEADFDLLTKGRKSEPIPASNRVVNPERVFLEPGAKVAFSILNASDGPIYIGKDAEVMEGSMIRGGFALCDHGVVKMGAKIYGPTTAGPYCKIGGEISNSVLFAYSSKGHEGYLGNSVLGEWCNLGADTNNSNLKNNYAKVKLWNYGTGRFVDTGLQFCGLMMGDHSKTAINTMINTGTVVGVNVNLFSAGFPRNFVPSFSWGGASGFTTYQTRKAFETASVVMARRKITFDEVEARILEKVFELTARYRKS